MVKRYVRKPWINGSVTRFYNFGDQIGESVGINLDYTRADVNLNVIKDSELTITCTEHYPVVWMKDGEYLRNKKVVLRRLLFKMNINSENVSGL